MKQKVNCQKKIFFLNTFIFFLFKLKWILFFFLFRLYAQQLGSFFLKNRKKRELLFFFDFKFQTKQNNILRHTKLNSFHIIITIIMCVRDLEICIWNWDWFIYKKFKKKKKKKSQLGQSKESKFCLFVFFLIFIVRILKFDDSFKNTDYFLFIV